MRRKTRLESQENPIDFENQNYHKITDGLPLADSMAKANPFHFAPYAACRYLPRAG